MLMQSVQDFITEELTNSLKIFSPKHFSRNPHLAGYPP